MQKTIIEHNFLGYELELKVDSALRTVTGYLIDDRGNELAINEAQCHPNDKFSEEKGIKIVKLRLAKLIHRVSYEVLNDEVVELEKELKQKVALRDYHKKRLDNTRAYLTKLTKD